MRAVRVEVIGPEKRCLLLQSVFLKMSESEHSDSEFYYPGELSDAEMLQLPTHNEATERKSQLANQENQCARNEAMLPRACPLSTKK